MKCNTARCALVSTNSITQGGAVANLWKPLFAEGIHIDFAYRTFRWDSESAGKAHVHCVIIGFSSTPSNKPKLIFDDGKVEKANNINGYLLDAPDIFIEKRMRPISNVPQINLGGQPIDDGNLVFTQDEYNQFVSQEPRSKQFFRPFMMGKDFIDRKPRWCLWLASANPSELKQCRRVLERVENVREFRLKSQRTSTLKAADSPMLFGAPFECKSDYVAIPKVSGGNRTYVPIDYLSKDIIPGRQIVYFTRTHLYITFGILTSFSYTWRG